MSARSRIADIPALRELLVPAVLAALGAAAIEAKDLLLPVNIYDAGISASAGTFIHHGLVPTATSGCCMARSADTSRR